MDYSQKTADLIERQCRCVERSSFRLQKKKAEELILKTYDLFELERPKNIVWCKDIFSKVWVENIDSAGSAWSAWSAWSAGSAGSAGSAWSAGSAQSARSAWSAWSAGSAGSAGSAWSAGSAQSAWSAGSAQSARSAWSAWSAGSALDYDFDYYVIEHEYIENPDKEYPVNENDYKYLEYCNLLMEAKEVGLGYRFEYEDTLYLAPTPIVRIDQQARYHSDTFPSIEWKGANKFYNIHGVSFQKDLWEKVVSKKMYFEDILAIEDIDQRTQAMKYGDVRKFLEHVKSEKLDEYNKLDINGETVHYELHKIPSGDIFNKDVHYMIYNCPSTKQEYMSGVPEFKTVPDAMAWKSYMTPEDWKLLIPLVNEA